MLSKLNLHKPIKMEFVALAFGMKNVQKFTNRAVSTKLLQYPVRSTDLQVQGFSRRSTGKPWWQTYRFQSQAEGESGSEKERLRTSGKRVMNADIVFDDMRGQLSMMILGAALAGAIIYYVVGYMFLGSEIDGIYQDALNRCLQSEEVKAALGTPITVLGVTRGGTGKHPAYTEYEDAAGKKHLKMSFYLQGRGYKLGTVHLEVKQNDQGNYKGFHYLCLQLDDKTHRTLIIEDNR